MYLELSLGIIFNGKLARVSNGNSLGGLAAAAALSLDGLDDVHAFYDLTEDHVLIVQPRGDNGGDKELRAIGVLACLKNHISDIIKSNSLLINI